MSDTQNPGDQAADQTAPATPQGPQPPYIPQPGYPGAGQPPASPYPPHLQGSPGYPVAQPPRPAPPRGLAIAALVVGIGSLVLCLLPFIGNFIGIIGGITAVVLGIIALKKAQPKGMSVTGVVTGGLAVILSIIGMIISLVFIGAAFTTASTALSELGQSSQEATPPAPDSPDAPVETTDPNTSDSGDRSAQFCAALDTVMETSTGSYTAAEQIPAEVLDAYRALSEVASPNQAIYQEFYEFMKDPMAASSNPDFTPAIEDFTTALMDDAMSCL